MGAWRVVGAATAVWHGVTNRRSIEKWLGVMHMAWGGGVMLAREPARTSKAMLLLVCVNI